MCKGGAPALESHWTYPALQKGIREASPSAPRARTMQNTGTQWGCVLGSHNFSLPQGPSPRVEEALLKGSTRQAATVPNTILASPWHIQPHPGGRKASGCMLNPQALILHLLPTPSSLFSRRGTKFGASRLNWKPSSSSERSELWLVVMRKRCP